MLLINAIKNYFIRAGIEAEDAHKPPGDGRKISDGISGGWYSSDALDGRPWIGVDLDGTLAYHEAGSSIAEIGPPIDAMMARVKQMLAEGRCVKIFTARATDPDQLPLIQKWLRENGLPPLEITNCKDFKMIVLYDDRCIQVEPNTGKIVSVDFRQWEDSYQK